MTFSMETEQESKLSFPEVETIRKQGKFATIFIENVFLVAYLVIMQGFYLPFIKLVGYIL